MFIIISSFSSRIVYLWFFFFLLKTGHLVKSFCVRATPRPRGEVKWKLLSCVWLFATPWTTVCGILQARILECVAFPFSRGSSQPRDQTQVSHIAGSFFISWATREGQGVLYPKSSLTPIIFSLQKYLLTCVLGKSVSQDWVQIDGVTFSNLSTQCMCVGGRWGTTLSNLTKVSSWDHD